MYYVAIQLLDDFLVRFAQFEVEGLTFDGVVWTAHLLHVWFVAIFTAPAKQGKMFYCESSQMQFLQLLHTKS